MPIASGGVGATLLLAGGLLIYEQWFFAQPLNELTRDGVAPARSAFFLFLLTAASDVWADRWFGAGGAVLFDRTAIALAAALILAVGWAAGRIALRLTGIDRHLTRLEHFVFATGVGLNLLSLGTLGLGLAGAVRSLPSVLVAGVAIVGASAWLAWRDRQAGRALQPLNPLRPSDRRSAWWLVLAIPFVLVTLLGGMLPASDFDVREYHLQAPKEFFLTGRIEFLPHNVYANMPLGTEMHSLLGMILLGDWWSGALVGKTVQACFAPLTALGLLAAGRRWYSTRTGVLAAIIYVSTPWIVHVSTAGLVEGAAAFYAFAAVYAWMLWRDEQAAAPAENSAGHLLLTGFLAGSAVATKYPAALFVVVPLLVLVLWRGRPRRVRWATLFLLAVLAGCGPWLAKNAWFTGNPTYPLLYNVFGGSGWTPQQNARWQAAHRPPNFEIFGDGTAKGSHGTRNLADSLAEVVVRSPWLNFVTWPLAIVALLTGARRRNVALLWCYLLFVLTAWWLFTHRIDRFWVPALPIASLLAGIGATVFARRSWYGVVAVALLLALSYDFAVVATNTGPGSSNRFFVPLAELRRDPERVTPWQQWLNQHTPTGKQVLSEGDAQVFDLEVPVIYHTAFDESPLMLRIAGKTPAERRAALGDLAYVYVNWGEIARYRSPGNYGYTEQVQPAVLEELVRQGILGPPLEEFQSSGVEIYPVR